MISKNVSGTRVFDPIGKLTFQACFSWLICQDKLFITATVAPEYQDRDAPLRKLNHIGIQTSILYNSTLKMAHVKPSSEKSRTEQ